MYSTRAGDTFESIARKVYGDERRARLIAQANPGVVEPLAPGTVLATPPAPGAPADKIPQAPTATGNEVALLIGGTRFRFWSDMRITRSLDAMDLVLKRHDVQLVMVGDPLASGFLANHPELKVKIDASEALKSHCTFTGFVPDETLAALYSRAQALVFPSLGEGFGLPAVEAMSQGVPVLASNAGSIQEIVADAGLYYPPLDAEEMARKITTFLSDPKLQATLRDRARKRIRRFTWERAADLAMESFERAVS